MSSVCSQAVKLPEIVAAILEQMHNIKALWVALQVNRLWADEATILLWRDTPIRALDRIEDAKRLQYYADKISSLNVGCWRDGCQGHSRLRQLRFPRLSEISTNAAGYDHNHMFLQGPQPRLRTLQWYGGPIPSDYLQQVQARCSALRSLRLSGWDGEITANEFIQFLENMPSLTRFRFLPSSRFRGDLRGDLKGSIYDEVFVHLASRPSLTSLVTNHTTTLGHIKKMQGVVKQPFPELVHLECYSESKAIGQLSRHLTRLTKLDLSLVDAAENMVFDICSCTNLVSLKLHFTQGSHFDAKSHFPPKSLLALAESCSHLQNFIVTHGRNTRGDYGVTDIKDNDIQKFVDLLPGLSRFRLQIRSNVTERALQILGEGCATMNDCALDGEDFNLRLLGSSRPVLFPQLEILELTPSVWGHSADDVAQIFHRHAPRATTLDVGSSRWFGIEVLEKIRELKRQDKVRSLSPGP